MNKKRLHILISTIVVGCALGSLSGSLLYEVIPEKQERRPSKPMPEKKSVDYAQKLIQMQPFGDTTDIDAIASGADKVVISSSLNNASLIGTMSDSGQQVGYLSTDGGVISVRKGNKLSDGEVLNVSKDEVTLLVNGRTVTIGANKKARSSARTTSSKSSQSISRSAVNRAKSNISGLLRSAQMVPRDLNGSIDGFTVKKIARGSILENMGITEGDVILQVNGISLDSPSKAAAVLKQIQEATSVKVGVERNGQKQEFEYTID